MVKTMRDAKSLSWTSQYRWTGENGVELARIIHEIVSSKTEKGFALLCLAV